MDESLTARADDADVLALAEKTGRSPEGIAARANALDRGELARAEEVGRGRPFLRALLGLPDALACALLANCDSPQPAGGEPEFDAGDWQMLEAVVLALGADAEDTDGDRYAGLEFGEGGALRDSLSIGLGPERCVVVWTGVERYVAAELAGMGVAA